MRDEPRARARRDGGPAAAVPRDTRALELVCLRAGLHPLRARLDRDPATARVARRARAVLDRHPGGGALGHVQLPRAAAGEPRCNARRLVPQPCQPLFARRRLWRAVCVRDVDRRRDRRDAHAPPHGAPVRRRAAAWLGLRRALRHFAPRPRRPRRPRLLRPAGSMDALRIRARLPAPLLRVGRASRRCGARRGAGSARTVRACTSSTPCPTLHCAIPPHCVDHAPSRATRDRTPARSPNHTLRGCSIRLALARVRVDVDARGGWVPEAAVRRHIATAALCASRRLRRAHCAHVVARLVSRKRLGVWLIAARTD